MKDPRKEKFPGIYSFVFSQENHKLEYKGLVFEAKLELSESQITSVACQVTDICHNALKYDRATLLVAGMGGAGTYRLHASIDATEVIDVPISIFLLNKRERVVYDDINSAIFEACRVMDKTWWKENRVRVTRWKKAHPEVLAKEKEKREIRRNIKKTNLLIKFGKSLAEVADQAENMQTLIARENVDISRIEFSALRSALWRLDNQSLEIENHILAKKPS